MKGSTTSGAEAAVVLCGAVCFMPDPRQRGDGASVGDGAKKDDGAKRHAGAAGGAFGERPWRPGAATGWIGAGCCLGALATGAAFALPL